MSKGSKKLIIISVVAYLVYSQIMFKKYNKEFDKLLTVNTELLQACSAASEGVDMEEEYIK